MAEATIPVNLLNPGQVFACLGVMEAADILIGDAAGIFDWSNGAGDTVFRLSAAGTEHPVERVMQFLEEAAVITRAPAQSSNIPKWKKTWGTVPEDGCPGCPFPFPDPNSPATLPGGLRDNSGVEITVNYWGDSTRRDNVKFWAGAGGYPGTALLRDALSLVRGRASQHADNPFALSSAQSSSFRFDWRGGYVPKDIGFSLNKHKRIVMNGFPLVEILAAIGVTNARPARMHKLEYRYGVVGGRDPVDPILLRATLGTEVCPILGASFRRFAMLLDNPGKDDRCITQVTEMTTAQEHIS